VEKKILEKKLAQARAQLVQQKRLCAEEAEERQKRELQLRAGEADRQKAQLLLHQNMHNQRFELLERRLLEMQFETKKESIEIIDEDLDLALAVVPGAPSSSGSYSDDSISDSEASKAEA
jgi:hypothetical protein